jgi:pimeloyl-ACP methyl ester carboxylesterase
MIRPDRLIHSPWLLSTIAVLVLAACSSATPDTTTHPTNPKAASDVAAPTATTSASATAQPADAISATASYTPTFTEEPCTSFELAESASATFRCGFLRVPEERGNPESHDVRLAVAIIPSQREQPAPDPLIFLEGGPGGRAMSGAAVWADLGYNATRDVILLDQRGTGASEPSLNCPEMNWYSGDLEENLDATDGTGANGGLNNPASYLESALECHARLEQAGINLAMYTSATIAADVEDLRQALGYKQVNLLGISYGTRVALTMMRDAPQHIRSVVLDSVYPIHIDDYEEQAAVADRSLHLFFDDCAADPVCSAAYPDLETVFSEQVARLNAAPVTVVQTDAETGEAYEVYLDGVELFDTVDQGLYVTDVIPELPMMIYETAAGNYDLLAELSEYLLWVPIDMPDQDSEGMFYSVICHEELPFNDHDEVLAASDPESQIADYIIGNFETDQRICEQWGAGTADPLENEAVQSDIPTLILSGEYDPRTPPQWGEVAAATLENSYSYTFPGSGHGVSLDGGCPTRIAQSFLEDPTSAPPAGCIDEMEWPAFVVEE